MNIKQELKLVSVNLSYIKIPTALKIQTCTKNTNYFK